jgi:hypothetical protein
MARLRAVDGVPEDPAVGDEGRYRGPDVGHHANALVPEGATLLLVWRAMGGDLHDVRVVLGQPRIDAQDVCF